MCILRIFFNFHCTPDALCTKTYSTCIFIMWNAYFSFLEHNRTLIYRNRSTPACGKRTSWFLSYPTAIKRASLCGNRRERGTTYLSSVRFEATNVFFISWYRRESLCFWPEIGLVWRQRAKYLSCGLPKAKPTTVLSSHQIPCWKLRCFKIGHVSHFKLGVSWALIHRSKPVSHFS